ncbi:MAG: VOC family protein [Nitrososphaerales archaeon]
MVHLRYFGIRVTDLQRSLEFYTKGLGLKEASRGDMSQYGVGRGTWVLLRDPLTGQQLELNWYPKDSHYATAYAAGEGLDHIGFVVSDVQKKYNELLAMGALPTDLAPENTEGWQACVKDPDGNWIELGRGECD